jgi:hypothetical protein
MPELCGAAGVEGRWQGCLLYGCMVRPCLLPFAVSEHIIGIIADKV